MFRFSIILILCTAAVVRAETPENLTQANAFPDEIIARLDAKPTPKAPARSHEIIQIGTVVSLYRHKEETDLYDFTISVPDNTVIIVTQDNELNLKPGDTVSLMKTDEKTLIKGKITL